MTHRFTRLGLVVSSLLLGLVLMGCAAKPSAEAIAGQVVDALAKGDVATLTTLLDDEMPMKDLEIPTMLRLFREDSEVTDADLNYGFGPLQSTTVQTAKEAGASMIVPVLLHHRDGEGSIDITLHQTGDGWRVLDWDLSPGVKKGWQ